MKSVKILLALIALVIAGAHSAGARSFKRGVSENEFQYKAQMAALAPGVSWYYNWGPSVGAYLTNETQLEFVPMCWNGNFNADRIRTYVAAHPEVKYLLGFNEPNFTNQANMTPSDAAARWPEVKALAAELKLKIVAPAMNYSPNPPYQSPTLWMDQFVALVGSDAFDYVAIHSYGGFGVLKDLATTFHERYGKDVWVTEFCLWPNEGNPNSTVLPESQIGSMIESVQWLEKTEWIYRYAWFKAIGQSSASTGPNYGLLLTGKGENPRELSEQGKVYCYMPDFDTEKYHPIAQYVPSADFIASNSVLLGTNNDPTVDYPIEITRFNAGAWADYQVDVPTAGKYTLTLRVSGQGEPVRFDPTIGIFAADADGNEGAQLAAPRQFGLPGNNTDYKEETFELNLQAGHQIIRIKDTAPGQPSGIRISSLRLDDVAGVENIIVTTAADNQIYDLMGRPVKNPSAGIYIINGNKIIIK